MRAVWLALALMAPTFAVAADTDSDTDSDTDASTDTDGGSDTYPSGGLGAAALSGEKGGCACDATALAPAGAGLVVAAGLLAWRRRSR